MGFGVGERRDSRDSHELEFSCETYAFSFLVVEKVDKINRKLEDLTFTNDKGGGQSNDQCEKWLEERKS